MTNDKGTNDKGMPKIQNAKGKEQRKGAKSLGRKFRMSKISQYAVHAHCFFCGEIDLRFEREPVFSQAEESLGSLVRKSSQHPSALRNPGALSRMTLRIREMNRPMDMPMPKPNAVAP